jgi:anthranilate phosphoribosyltransferase
VLGVYREDLVEKLAHVLKKLGCRRGYVVHGCDGMDEVTLTGESTIGEVGPDGVKVYKVTPEQFGLERAPLTELHGGDAQGNAVIVRDILSGKDGAKRRIVLLNAAYALLAAGKVQDVAEGIRLATETIDSGSGLKQLERLIALTNEVA